MNGKTAVVFRDLRLDESGRVVTQDGGGLDLGLGMMFAGESVVFTLLSEDGAAKAAVEITPFPLEAEGDGGCRLTVKLMSVKGDSFQIIGEGFRPGRPVTAVGSPAGEVTQVPLTRKSDGLLTAIVSPAVAGKSGGEATLTASDGSCSVTAGYSWGDAMMKRSPRVAQPAVASVTRESTLIGEAQDTRPIACSASATLWIDGIQVEPCVSGQTVTISSKPGKHAVRAQSLDPPPTNWLEIVDAHAGAATTLRLEKGGKTSTGEMTQAPKGFHWEQATAIKGAFMVPDGWFFRVDQTPTRLTYLISRTDTHLGYFKVGLTVNVNRGAKGEDAVAYAKKVVAVFSKGQGKTLRRSWDIKSNLLSGAGCDVEFVPVTGREVLGMELLMLGNPRTNATYYITFEAPKTEWEEAWKLGREIMSQMKLSDDF
jgi:hypothetical protein